MTDDGVIGVVAAAIASQWQSANQPPHVTTTIAAAVVARLRQTGMLAPPIPEGMVMLNIPCAPELLPMLERGVATSRIVLQDNRGDGTHDLIVHGPRGPLSDPFADVRDAQS